MAGIGHEIGRQGQKRHGGTFYEEFLKPLKGSKGIKVYTEMAENDDVIGAILFAMETLMQQANWSVQPAGDTEKDIEAAEFVEGCLHDMQIPWEDTISEILSFLTYGWSVHEIVYKRRMGRKRDPRINSKYDDGLIGWQKMPIRAQDTLYEWNFDDRDNLLGMVQMPPPDYGLIEIPADKFLLFRTKNRKGNPEGKSILRTAYRDWVFKKRIQEIEGIGIERDLAGFPVLTGPDGMDLFDNNDSEMVTTRKHAEIIVQNIRRDSMEGLVIPHGWEFSLVSTGGKRQFDTNQIIERYDTRIAMTTLADFVLLGHQNVGSFALSSNKTKLFAMAVGSYLNIICSQFNNKAIPDLIDLNKEHFRGITDYPELIHGDIEDPNLTQLAEILRVVTGQGLITPDEELEDWLREIIGLPERIADGDYPLLQDKKSETKEETQTDREKKPDPAQMDDSEDDPEVEKARKRLGRTSR